MYSSLSITALARERPPALQILQSHLTSPVHLGTSLTGALALATGISEAHRFSRTPYAFCKCMNLYTKKEVLQIGLLLIS